MFRRIYSSFSQSNSAINQSWNILGYLTPICRSRRADPSLLQGAAAVLIGGRGREAAARVWGGRKWGKEEKVQMRLQATGANGRCSGKEVRGWKKSVSNINGICLVQRQEIDY